MTNHLRLSARAGASGVIVVELDGEIDLSTAPTLTAALQAVQIPPPPSGALVLLDLSRVAFCDVAGLNAIVRSARILAERGARLALAAPRRPVRKLLGITHLNGYFEVFPSLLAAGASATARQSAAVSLESARDRDACTRREARAFGGTGPASAAGVSSGAGRVAVHG